MSDLESEIENEWDEPALDPALEGDEPTELEVQQMLDGTPDVPEPAPKRPKRLPSVRATAASTCSH